MLPSENFEITDLEAVELSKALRPESVKAKIHTLSVEMNMPWLRLHLLSFAHPSVLASTCHPCMKSIMCGEMLYTIQCVKRTVIILQCAQINSYTLQRHQL